MFNFIGNLSGITVPLIIGYLARDYGFSAGLIYVATLALLGSAVVHVRGGKSGAITVFDMTSLSTGQTTSSRACSNGVL